MVDAKNKELRKFPMGVVSCLDCLVASSASRRLGSVQRVSDKALIQPGGYLVSMVASSHETAPHGVSQPRSGMTSAAFVHVDEDGAILACGLLLWPDTAVLILAIFPMRASMSPRLYASLIWFWANPACGQSHV